MQLFLQLTVYDDLSEVPQQCDDWTSSSVSVQTVSGAVGHQQHNTKQQ